MVLLRRLVDTYVFEESGVEFKIAIWSVPVSPIVASDHVPAAV
jgi:hypothetical protein